MSFLVWWKPDAAEMEKQVSEYSTLKVTQSSRGVSMLLCALSVAVTTLLGPFLHLGTGTIVFEAALWGGLGLAMFRGKRWAFILGMVFWTIEKAMLMFGGAPGGRTPFIQVIWWLAYMNAFYQGYTVETLRREGGLASAA